nr:nitrous oxide reductase accessory protein NosL [uncultured Roseateles sp.]
MNRRNSKSSTSALRTAVLCAVVALGLGACGRSDDAKAVAAAEIDAHSTCELDGMLLADYPGPKAQIHYAGQAAPSFFCDTVELLNTLLAPEQVRAIKAVYVQDMGSADWDQPRGFWIDAKSAIYVLDSSRQGSMGPTIASFAKEADAKAFAAKWGGKPLRFAEITRDMVDLSGGALHDGKM